ncbi:MAG: HlyD family secretion protein [Coleofasciculus sp. S288]|nr:HlyD family secretion protein [Coleofasciculus sp. S288]
MNQNNGSKSKQQLILGTPPVSNQQPEVTVAKDGNNSVSTGNGKFDQPVILRQSRGWSRGILWTIIGVTTFGVIWASVAKIDQAVPAQGKLEPQDAVKEVQAPVSGVVTELNVEDGKRVEQGEVLLRLDPTVAQAELKSLIKIKDSLIKENGFYRAALRNPASPPTPPPDLEGSRLDLSSELPSLLESRNALFEENRLYRTQLIGDSQGANLSPKERERLRVAASELNSRVAANELEVGQLKRQLAQNEVQLSNARSRLEVQQEILDNIQVVAQEGGIAKIQYLNQQQEVKTRQAEVDQLVVEQSRLELDIAQAEQQLLNTKAASNKDLTDLIAANDKQINDVNSRIDAIKRSLRETILGNEKRIAEIDSQLSQTKVNLSYQELRAPVGGTVFDLQPSAPGFVTSTTEPILKIVPDDTLMAKVYLTNKDIGFVREGMLVDVRIDSFPFSEFGDIKGELVWIGSDALPPDQIRPYYSFPAKVKLNRQSLMINGKTVPLQSGMSVSTNILVRDRTVLSIFTDLFVEKTESLKTVR